MKKRGRPIRDDGGRKDLQYRLRLSFSFYSPLRKILEIYFRVIVTAFQQLFHLLLARLSRV